MTYRTHSFLTLVLGTWLVAGILGCERPPAATDEEVEQAVEPAALSSKSSKAAPPDPQAPAPQTAQGTEQPASPSTKASASASADPLKSINAGEGDACVGLCERTVSLGCGPRDACMDNCAAMLADKLCPERMQAFMTCALSKPARDWECTPDQVAAVRDGVCDKQQRDFILCAQRATSRDLLAR